MIQENGSSIGFNHYVSIDGQIGAMPIDSSRQHQGLSLSRNPQGNSLEKPSAPGISPWDRGFLYGDGLMETMLVFKQKPVLVERHLARLRWGGQQLGIPIPWKDEALLFELRALIETQAYDQGYLRLVVTAGFADGLVRANDDQVRPTKIFYYGPWAPRNLTIYDQGVTLKRKVSPLMERRERVKLCYYLPEILALKQGQKAGYDDILWAREDGELMEASTANLFLIGRIGDQVEIVTPPAQSGILLGVTRQKMLELLFQAKIPVSEQLIYADELPRFDEAFLTSSLAGLVPIRSIDRHQLHTPRKGSTFQHLQRLYRTWMSTLA